MKHYATITVEDGKGHEFTLGVSGRISGQDIEILKIEILSVFDKTLICGKDFLIELPGLTVDEKRHLLDPLLANITRQFRKSYKARPVAGCN